MLSFKLLLTSVFAALVLAQDATTSDAVIATATESSASAVTSSAENGTYYQACFNVPNSPCQKGVAAVRLCSAALVLHPSLANDTAFKKEQSCYCDEDGDGRLYWQSLEGCCECGRLHGVSIDQQCPERQIDVVSSKYCALWNPTQLASAYIEQIASEPTIATLTDPIVPLTTTLAASQTDVSLYFTASTGKPSSAAASGTSSGGTSVASSGTTSAASGAAAETGIPRLPQLAGALIVGAGLLL